MQRTKEFWESLSDDQKLELMIIYEDGGRLDASREGLRIYVVKYRTERGFSPLTFLDLIREEILGKIKTA